VLESGDVKARTLVRVEEAHEAVGLIRQALVRMGSGPLAVALRPRPVFEPAFALVEGWRGTIIHWVMANAAGRLERVEVLDPSFLNWRALSYALLQNIVLDPPLCNKSFDQSYSGNDLWDAFRRHARVLHPAARRSLLDTASVSADRGAHRATHVEPPRDPSAGPCRKRA
jgi:Ni,Fe-hydrogenase III large subunit